MILQKTQSLCTFCKRVVEASYVSDDEPQGGTGRVYYEKICPEHGSQRVLATEKTEDYLEWTAHPVVNIPPKKNITTGNKAESQCPLHCGTCTAHLQTACCVLIDVTDKCDQNCPFCFAKANEGENKKDITIQEIEKKYDLLLALGEERPFNIQLSGGEPTTREDLPEIISAGRERGFSYIQINTNGRRIALEKTYAKKLKAAGASVIYLQFDGTTEDIHIKLRGEALLDLKRRAIENCREAGLPVALVPTITKDANLKNIGKMVEFLLENIDIVKGIHFQPAAFFGRHTGELDSRVTMFDVMHALEEQTKGLVRYEDLCPISTGHTLCCFYGTFKKEGVAVRSMLSEEAKAKGVDCCGEIDPMAVIKKDRDYVLNKWEVAEEYPCCCGQPQGKEVGAEQQIMDLDSFLAEVKGNLFTLSGMAFMDMSNLDSERLKRCRVQQLTDDNRLIPFCAYNSMYRV